MDKLWMAPNGLHIEPGEARDSDAMARLHAQGFYRGWPREDFASFLAEKNTPAYIACNANRKTVAGFALIRQAGDEAELLTIAVDPKWRSKGVGAALMRAFLDDLRLSPTRSVFLEVDEKNLPAVKLYRRFGFAEVGRRTGYYKKADGSEATALVMRANLG